jgi:hypothetical protein
MADIKQKFGTNGQALTLTIASLANSSARQSTEVDNTTNLYMDVLLTVKVKSAAASTSATGYVNVFAFGTVDNGTTRSEGAGASDAAITLAAPSNLRFVGVISVVANSTTYVGGPFSVAAAFGGVMPAYWGIVLENKTGATLDSTAGNHSALYQGVFGQTV